MQPIERVPRSTIRSVLSAAAILALPVFTSTAAQINWQGGTASYNTPADWVGGVVPGASDNAVNDNGSNNVVQINIGDPDWTLLQLVAGNSSGNGSFLQNGQTLTVTDNSHSLRLGLASGFNGYYTLNGGTIVSAGEITIGELGSGTLNINGGTIYGGGTLSVNRGASTPTLSATMDGGTGRTGYTWIEQGYYTPTPGYGLPAAGNNLTSAAQSDHSYTMAPSYVGNNVVMVDSNVVTATITPTSPAAASALSFLGAAGHGPMTVNYTITHADTSTENGTLTVPDWFDSSGTYGLIAANTGARVDVNGNFQTPGAAPYAETMDINLSNTTSPVTGITLNYTTGAGVVCIFGVSSSIGSGFSPVAISGYNEDMIAEAAAGATVASSVTDVVNQTAGVVNMNGELHVGKIGNGIYNFSNGSINASNWFVIGRSGGNGTMNMTGGSIYKSGNGAFIVGSEDGGSSFGTLNHSAGTIVSDGEYWIGNSGAATGTNNISGSASVSVNNWVAIGRGGNGTLNISGGSLTKTGNAGNHLLLAAFGNNGTVNQNGGAVTNVTSETWIGETGNGTWNLNAGAATFSVIHLGQNGGANGTLNVNGGTLTASELTSASALSVSTLNLNGGIVRVSGDTVNFIHDIYTVQLQAGGVTFDSQNHDVTIGIALPGSGGLTKIGTGILRLTAPNSYSGPTIVQEGTLAVTTDNTGAGDYNVADTAQLSLKVQSANAQLNVANMDFSNGTPALSIDLGSFGNPTAAPINASGTVIAEGAVAVSIADTQPGLGQFPLIKYGSLSGAGSFVLASLPVGLGAFISNNIVNGSIDLVITNVNLPRWEGLAGGTWDVEVTTNWINIGTGLPTFFGQGNAVVFDDNAQGTTSVNINATVNPNSVTVNNNTLSYTFTGSGAISGATGLTKGGTGSLTIANNGNNYTGVTTLSGGSLSVANLANGGASSAIGAASSSPTNLVFNGGNLTYTGPATTINRGYTAQSTNSSITVSNDLTLSGTVNASLIGDMIKLGTAQLTYTTVGSNLLSGSSSSGYIVQEGTVKFDGTGGQTNYINGPRLGVDDLSGNAKVIFTNVTINTSGNIDLGNVANTGGSVTMDNSTVNVGSWLVFGDGGNSGGTLTLNSGTLNVTHGRILMGGRPGAMSTLNINGGVLNKNNGQIDIADGNWNGSGTRTGIVNQAAGTLNSFDELWVGQSATGVGFYNFSGGTMNISNWVAIGRGSSVGTMTMTGGTFNKRSNGNLLVGTSAGNNGTVSVGRFDISGGTLNCDNEFWVGENALDIGTNNISGTAVVNWNNWVSIGRHGLGVVNISGGTINRSGNGSAIVVGDNVGGPGNGYVNQTGGTLTSQNELWVGQNSTGRYDLSGTGSVTINNWVAIGRGGGNGTFNMTGGTFTKTGNGGNHFIIGAGGVGTLNQSGGTLTSVLSDSWIGESQTGVWNLNGGSVVMSAVHMPQNSGTHGTLNLNGGTFSATEMTTGNAGGLGTLNFNGGTLVAGTGANPNFLHGIATNIVLAGGAIIDSGTNTVSASSALLDGGGSGGLTKLGNGTLYLNGVNTYQGTTLASAGGLGGSGTIAGPVSVANGATLRPGTATIGTLTINNSLVLSNASKTFVKISMNGGGTNDVVTGLSSVTYGGSLVVSNAGVSTLVAGTQFHLFNASSATGNYTNVTVLPVGTATFNPATGILTITSSGVLALSSPSVSGGNLILTGSGGTSGGSFSLLSATNVTLPIASWTTNLTGTFDGFGSFSNAVPINPLEPARFYRLQVP